VILVLLASGQIARIGVAEKYGLLLILLKSEPIYGISSDKVNEGGPAFPWLDGVDTVGEGVDDVENLNLDVLRRR
jgi:hypothetical protein